MNAVAFLASFQGQEQELKTGVQACDQLFCCSKHSRRTVVPPPRVSVHTPTCLLGCPLFVC